MARLLLSQTLVISFGFAVLGCNSGAEEPPPQDDGCDAELRAEAFFAGMTRASARFSVALMASDPAPPSKGDNAWTLDILDAGGAQAEVDLAVHPFMPDHGHGTPIQAAVSRESDGRYTVAPVNLWMPGFWEVSVDLDDGSGETETVKFSFCIDG